MYEQFYGLKETPFSLTPDPDFLFVSKDYQSALDQVLRGIARREGFTVIVGDVGTGKTTLCWAILGRLERGLKTALILNPMLDPDDMLRAILQDFGVVPHRPGELQDSSQPRAPDWTRGLTKKDLIDELNRFLLEQAQADVFCVLIIDEAQDLSLEVLRQLRLLSNLETSKKKLLQIIFVGQIEFTEKLKERELRSLNQRIATRFELQPLSQRESATYVAHRLKVAKASGRLVFTAGALKEIYRNSRGYPRLVNLICDRALLAGHSEKSWTITKQMVRKAATGLRSGGALPRARWIRRIPFPLRFAVTVTGAVLALALLLGWRGQVLSIPESVPEPAIPGQVPSAPEPPPRQEPAALPQVPAVATESAPSPVPAEPGAPREGQYHVQVHSFLVEDQALSARRDLESQGFPVEIRTDLHQGGTRWFVVVTGPFDDIESARTCAARLKTKGGISPIIVRRTL